MSDTAVVNPTLVINNIAIPVRPNSVTFKEGKGEQNMRVQSAGGGNTDIVYSENVESNISSLMFEIINTAANIELARGWKTNRNANAGTLTGQGLSRSFNNMAILNDYEVQLSSDGVIAIEMSGDPAA